MARVLGDTGGPCERLCDGWTLALSPAGAAERPAHAAGLQGWIPAQAPGTAAAALRAAGLWRADQPTPLHDQDVWYRRPLAGAGPCMLRFEGLATLAEVWLDERLLIQSDSMYLTHEADVDLAGGETLWLCFRALAPRLAQKGPRARWRPQMITPQGVRTVRTTLLGHMPGWCPPVDAVGPWRQILLLKPTSPRLRTADVRATLDDGGGVLSARLVLENFDGEAHLECAGQSEPLVRDADGAYRGRMTLPEARPWWPHTHGDQPLYEVRVRAGEAVFDLGRTGFRSLVVDRGADGRGFGLVINGEAVFCRGACWNPADVVALSGERADYEPRLRLAREAGMNMLRVGGTGVYESPAFHALCDELGILVWQDFMFANFDYPIADPQFAKSVADEAAQVLDAIQLSPSLAVLCGGSEAQQQAAMLGLPAAARASRLFDDILPHAASEARPDVAYVANSPSGGALPFVADEGVAHYYGVGAYCRPLEDARRAEVRFAGECLAFANVPQPRTLARDLPATAPVHDPRWKAGVPRDRGASWDFEDIRDHYLQLLYGHDPSRLRRENPPLYLDLSRAVTGEVMEAVYAEWRRSRSPCAGGLVWTLQDLQPGAGWGVIDLSGEPKPAWYALKRAFRPIQVALTDEGCNGLAVHLHNETAHAIEAELRLACLREGAQPVVQARRAVTLEPRSAQELSAYALFGAFFDVSYAYRFGPPSHDVTVATLVDAGSGEPLAEAFDFPLGRGACGGRADLKAEVERVGSDWALSVSSDRLAQSVHIEDPHFRPADDGFHLSPLQPRRILLHRRDGAPEDARPQGQVSTPGSASVTSYAATEGA